MSAIHISKTDHRILSNLIAEQQTPHARLPEHIQALKNELDRAELKEPGTMSPDIITLQSRARLRNLDADEVVEYTLVPPEEADIEEGKISILAPLGTAMLGYRVGDTFAWKVPAGESHWKVEKVTSPELAAEQAAAAN